MGSLREGEAKVSNTHRQGEKTMPHTSAPGQANIRRELDSLNADWDGLITRMNDTQQGLIQAIQGRWTNLRELKQKWTYIGLILSDNFIF